MLAYSTCTVLTVASVRPLSLETNEFIGELVRIFMDPLSSCQNASKVQACLKNDLDDIRKSRKGDSEAYRRLVQKHQEHVGRILWRFSRDLGVHEELIQDVFVEAYLSLGSFRGRAPFAHWLARIATRVGYRHWKGLARQGSTKSFSLHEWDQLPEENVEQADPAQAAALVHSFLAQLSVRDRLVLTLRYLDKCNVAETARRTGWSRTMVKVQTWRALRRLEKLLAKAGKDIGQ